MTKKRKYKFSAAFVRRIKLYNGDAQDLALTVGLNPSKLSRFVNGVDTVRRADKRLHKLGRLVGLKKKSLFKWVREVPAI